MNENGLYNVITRIRVFATLVIVAYHCACPYYAWQWGGYLGDKELVKNVVDFTFLHLLDNTMLPVFFCISGVLFYSRKEHYADRLATLWKKFDRLMVPYALIFLLCAGLDLPQIGVSSADGHLWFVRELFLFFCIALLLYRLPNWVPMLLGMTTFVLNIVSIKLGWKLPIIAEHTLMFFFYFALGCIIPICYGRLRRNIIRIPLFLLWGATLAINLQSAYQILFIFVLFAFIPTHNTDNNGTIVINKNSFGIYLLHHVMIFAIFPYVEGVYASSAPFAFVIMFVFASLISISLSAILRKTRFRYF